MQKMYFDQGLSILSYAKYFIYVFGAASFLNRWAMKWTALLFIGYGVLCYVVGWLAYNTKYMMAMSEIGNIYNPLARELRAHMQKQNERKH